ncbi:hypothetical protein [Nonomuraea sp. NPDC049709]|uniref:hypothetical protein n=1 Tax=Nonomuraea sp. NPDC049709 TaxID=3154736 RepID=UPI00344AFF36
MTNTAPGKNRVRITGRLYDKDPRDLSEGGKCAYIRFRYHYVGGDWRWTEYKHCGYNTVRPIMLTRYNVDEVRLKVCQVSWQPPHTPTSCRVKKIYPTVSPRDL